MIMRGAVCLNRARTVLRRGVSGDGHYLLQKRYERNRTPPSIQEKEGSSVPISYDKLFELLKEKGINTTRIRKENIIGQGTLTAIKKGTGGLDAKTIAKLCALLDCQPGDIMEYVPEGGAQAKGEIDHASI